MIASKSLKTMKEFSRQRFEKKLIQNIPTYSRDKVIEIDYIPGERLQIRRDIYNLTIAANITKNVTP